MAVDQKRDSRRLILSAAREEFGQHGFAGGRVDRIARRAGVNKQLLFYYFGSKAGLFRSVLESASSDIAGVAGKTPDRGGPLERLRAVADRVFDAVAAHGDLIRMSLLGAAAGDGARAILGEALASLSGTIRTLVSEGQGLGYVRDDVDPEIVARLVLATAVGVLALDGGQAEGGRATDLRRSAIDLIARALAW